MPIYPMYFQTLSPQQANPLGFGIQQGTDIANNILAARARALQNQQMQAQLPYAGQMAQADLAMKQAQVPYLQSETALNYGTMPYLGMKYSAPMLLAQARMAQAGIQNSNAFRQWTQTPEGAALVSNNPEMASAIAQAMQNSAGMINSGLPGVSNYNNPSSYAALPGAIPNMQGTPITPDQVNQLKNLVQPSVPISNIQDAASLQTLKKTSDASARQKNLYASNIEKTLNQINPDDLTQYAGRPISLFANQVVAPFSQESTNYDNYVKSLNAANLLATQVRQFYGDSIQPYMIKRLEGLTNPANWANNPTLAKAQFDKTKQILQQEMDTYRQAIQNKAAYQNQNTQSLMQTPSVSKVLNGVTYHKINGQWYAQ